VDQAPVCLDRVRNRSGKNVPDTWTKSIRSEVRSGADLNGIGNHACEPQQPSNIVALSMGGTHAISKPFLVGLVASAITCLCFLTWLHWKAVSLSSRNKERRG
jgi:hypothetical protein